MHSPAGLFPPRGLFAVVKGLGSSWPWSQQSQRVSGNCRVSRGRDCQQSPARLGGMKELSGQPGCSRGASLGAGSGAPARRLGAEPLGQSSLSARHPCAEPSRPGPGQRTEATALEALPCRELIRGPVLEWSEDRGVQAPRCRGEDSRSSPTLTALSCESDARPAAGGRSRSEHWPSPAGVLPGNAILHWGQ